MAFKLIQIGGGVGGARGFVSNEEKVQAIKRVAIGHETPKAVIGGIYQAQGKECPKMPSVVMRLWHKQVTKAIERNDRWIIKVATEAGILQETPDEPSVIRNDSALDRLNSEAAEAAVEEIEKKKNGKHKK